MFFLLSTAAVFGIARGQTFEERVDRYIASFPRHQEFHGVIFAAAGDRVFLQKGYGLADREFNIPHLPDDKFQVGSISKAFTAILILKMAELGGLRLDDTIRRHLPEYPEETGNRITIRHLLSHTSGIPHHVTAYPDYWLRHDKVFHSPRELLELFSRVPLAHEPGERMTYSSPGFYILGAILERVGQKSYAELLREYVFDPLGMKDSAVENNRTVRGRMAQGYMRGIEGLVRAGYEDKSTALAAGDLVTTARDLYLWDKGMRAGKILSPASVALLYKPILPDNIFTMGGPLLALKTADGNKSIRLNRLSGSSTGYVAAMDRIIDADACTIVLSNVQDADVNRIIDDVSDFFARHELGLPIGNPAPPTRTAKPAAAVSPADIELVLGFYGTRGDTISGVVRGGDKLYLMNYSGGGIEPPVLELVAEGSDSFNLGWLTNFKCRFSQDGTSGKSLLSTIARGRTVSTTERIEPADIDVSEFAGAYVSAELQRTFRFSRSGAGLVAEKFLGKEDVRLAALDKDLFGLDRGFILFTRYPDGAVSGFKLMTYATDTYLGSKFVKI